MSKSRLVETVYIEGVGAVVAVAAERLKLGSKVLLEDGVDAVVEARRSRHLGLSVELDFRLDDGRLRRLTMVPKKLIALG
jgi:hypothetical protein